MLQQNEQQKDEKQVLTMEEIEFVNKDPQEKYDELLQTSALLESEKAKWKATFDEFDEFYNNAPCGYHTLDDTGLILKMNQTELNWLGYNRNEVVNKMNIMDLLSEKSTILFYKYMPLLREKGHVDQLEVEYVRKNGAILYTLVSSRALFDENDHFKCVRSTLWDISDRKKMEDEMLKVNRHLRSIKERFEEKNTLVQKLNEELLSLKNEQNNFYNDSSFNIAQPLEEVSTLCISAISNSTQGSDVQQYLKQIRDTVAEVNNFVNNLRLQQRVLSNNTNLQITKFNLSSNLITIVNRLEEQAGKKKLTINCEIFEDLWINSDKELLGQVVDTLLSTVIKLSLPGKELPLRLIHKVNEYIVEMEISGLSISRQELADLFDKDKQQLANNTTGKGSELILDSHIINSLVENLGFELTVNPVNHKRTLIRLLIPGAQVG